MSNPIRLIRFPPEGLELVQEARIQAMREGKTLGQWLTEVLPDIILVRAQHNGLEPNPFRKSGSNPASRRKAPAKPGV